MPEPDRPAGYLKRFQGNHAASDAPEVYPPERPTPRFQTCGNASPTVLDNGHAPDNASARAIPPRSAKRPCQFRDSASSGHFSGVEERAYERVAQNMAGVAAARQINAPMTE